MKTRKLWALPGVLLALCLVLALPAAAVEAEAPEAEVPAAALEAEVPAEAPAAETGKTVRVTCDYPKELCTFTVRVPNTEQTWPLDSDIPYDEGKDYVWLDFEIGEIAPGYRIKRVRMDGGDRTESFVNGGYGGMATYIRADTAIQVELEEIPDSLPSVAGVRLYTDAALTREAEEHISYEAGSTGDRLYGKGTYSDGGDYPSYYATGQWEFSTDGVTWRPTRTWGSNRWDFWPGWQYHTELDFVSASYDIRLRVTPNNRYTSGGEVLSNVVHVNGGAGQSGGGGGEAPVKLANPTDLTWGRYRPDDTVDFAYNGMISWKEDTTQPEHTTWITVYRKGENGAADEEVFKSGHIVRQGAPLWRDEHDFVNNCLEELGDGVYYFTLQAGGDGITCAGSDLVRSGEWAYTAPGRQIAAPEGLEWSWPNAAWSPSGDPGAGGYIVDYYYSKDSAGLTSAGEAKRVGGYVWWFAEGEKTVSDAFHSITAIKRFLSNGAGYYYFRARTLSSDVLTARNSEPSALSAAYYYDGEEASGGTGGQASVSGVEIENGRLRFSVSTDHDTGKNGSLFLAGWRNGVLSDAAYTTKSSGDFSLNGETATVFFLEEETWIPLAEAVRVTVPAA